MIRSLSLEDFGVTGATAPAAAPPPVATGSEEAQLDAYEAGYKSGWDDCAAAEQEVHRRIGTDLSAALIDMSLTYEAARKEILDGLGPLFEEVARTLLPRLAAEAVAPTVIEELRKACAAAMAGTVTLVAAPQALPTLQRLIEDQLDADIRLEGEPAYAPAQVSVRSGQERQDIDLAAAADRIAAALHDFTTLSAEPGDAHDPIRRQAHDR